MPQFEVSIPYTGIQTRIVLADSPEEALEKAKEAETDWIMLELEEGCDLPPRSRLGGGNYAVDDHAEEIRLHWRKAKAVPLECELITHAELNRSFRSSAEGKSRRCGQGSTQ